MRGCKLIPEQYKQGEDFLRQIVLDTETTGLSPQQGHRIIEIGCIELINRRLTGKTFHAYMNPERAVELEASQVHGLTDAFLVGKPLFRSIADELLAFIRDAELIIHNAPFDVGFLEAELRRLGPSYKGLLHYCTVLDTLPLARNKHPGQPNSLDALCRRYRVDNSNRDLHGALIDSALLAKVYLAMTGGQLDLFGEVETEEVIEVQEKVSWEHTVRTPILFADDLENAAHRQWVESQRAQGVCLWEV
ncbi:MAG: DNA polymerase III subunit epsilon [Gammaproteobacteria bacterium RIFCSPHIGHO2_12_FULL_45_9]|nr:MAG: DNA polymerase III subunit epsilon [Gammaproteobacteria bacterium RIFCSPHIGHO2_12_FULL_45_9]